MAETIKLASNPAEVVAEQGLDTDLEFARIALELGPTGADAKVADEKKRALEAQLQAAKSVSGGRGYDIAPVVNHGHRTRSGVGGVALASEGLGQRPYGMPTMRTRRAITNPYINRSDLWR